MFHVKSNPILSNHFPQISPMQVQERGREAVAGGDGIHHAQSLLDPPFPITACPPLFFALPYPFLPFLLVYLLQLVAAEPRTHFLTSLSSEYSLLLNLRV